MQTGVGQSPTLNKRVSVVFSFFPLDFCFPAGKFGVF